MILMLHIFVALSSLVYTTYVFAAPSRSKLHLSYALLALTLISGTYLTVLHPSHLVSACMASFAYTVLTLGGTLLARRKLATQAM